MIWKPGPIPDNGKPYITAVERVDPKTGLTMVALVVACFNGKDFVDGWGNEITTHLPRDVCFYTEIEGLR